MDTVFVVFFGGGGWGSTSMIEELAVVRWDSGTELQESFRRTVWKTDGRLMMMMMMMMMIFWLIFTFFGLVRCFSSKSTLGNSLQEPDAF